jgi:hypothetical protein
VFTSTTTYLFGRIMQSSVNQKESRTFFGHPYPLGSLFFTEMWERFSFYGIRPLLILFMAATVYDGGMGLARENASAIVGILPVRCTSPRCRAAGWQITGSASKKPSGTVLF